MAWIESHQELGHHPKLKKLCRVLAISQPQAVGHLQFLWWWSVDYCADGDLSRFDAMDLAIGAMWDGDPEAFVSALVQCGWLDRDVDRLCIHDWDEYIGRLLDRRRKDAERKRTARNVPRTSVGCPPDVRDGPEDGAETAHVTVPNRTEPNPTEPEKTQEGGATAPAPVPAPRPSGAGPVPETTSAGRREPRRSRLPDDWQLTRELRVYATNRGLTDAEIEHEAEKFRAHWAGTGEAKANWAATWQSWVLRFLDRRAGPARASPNDPPAKPDFAARARAARLAEGSHP